jgi:hypothetical protein
MMRTLPPFFVLAAASVVACSNSNATETPTGSCQALATCCTHVPSAEETGCISVVADDIPSACDAQLGVYQTAGACGGAASTSGVGSQGSSGASTSSGGSNCLALTACCDLLTGADATSCSTVAGKGIGAACDAALAGYQSNGKCEGVVVTSSTSGVSLGSSGTTSRPTKDGGTTGPDATLDANGGDSGPSQVNPTTCAEAAALHSELGCDFWPTVTANLVESIFDFAAVVANGQSTAATVTVTGPGGFSTTLTVAPTSSGIAYLPWVLPLKGPDVDATDMTFPSSVFETGGAYHLVSDIPVAVYQFNALEYQGVGGPAGKDWSSCMVLSGATGCFSYTNDASLLLPTTSLTGNYVVTGEHGSGSLGGSIVSITATEASTSVTVTVSSKGAVVASAAGDAGVVGAASDVVELVGPADDDVDLSGSVIAANHPVEVLAARQCADQPDPLAACDHLESTVFPVETLGKDYVVTVPTSPNAAVIGHKVRFYGVADGTALTYSPSQPATCPSTLNAGEVVECLSEANCATGTNNADDGGGAPLSVACVPTTFEVKGSLPFAVSSFMLGGSAVDPGITTDALGDPSMSPMIPTEQYRSRYLFVAPTDYSESYADVVIPAGAALNLDGVAVAATPTAINAAWSVVRLTLSSGNAGAHVLTGTDPFGLQVIGYGAYTSYQYPAGLDLAHLSPAPPVH